jgi:hypothetical protein
VVALVVLPAPLVAPSPVIATALDRLGGLLVSPIQLPTVFDLDPPAGPDEFRDVRLWVLRIGHLAQCAKGQVAVGGVPVAPDEALDVEQPGRSGNVEQVEAIDVVIA